MLRPPLLGADVVHELVAAHRIRAHEAPLSALPGIHEGQSGSAHTQRAARGLASFDAARETASSQVLGTREAVWPGTAGGQRGHSRHRHCAQGLSITHLG